VLTKILLLSISLAATLNAEAIFIENMHWGIEPEESNGVYRGYHDRVFNTLTGPYKINRLHVISIVEATMTGYYPAEGLPLTTLAFHVNLAGRLWAPGLDIRLDNLGFDMGTEIEIYPGEPFFTQAPAYIEICCAGIEGPLPPTREFFFDQIFWIEPANPIFRFVQYEWTIMTGVHLEVEPAPVPEPHPALLTLAGLGFVVLLRPASSSFGRRRW
jgi:hypothetical protein